jgi:hypothetical protein
MMKLWRVYFCDESGSGFRFFATKAEARAWRTEYTNSGDDKTDGPADVGDVEPWEMKPTRRGIAHVLNVFSSAG